MEVPEFDKKNIKQLLKALENFISYNVNIRVIKSGRFL